MSKSRGSARVLLLAAIGTSALMAACEPIDGLESSGARVSRTLDFASSLRDRSPVVPLEQTADLDWDRVALGKQLFHDTRLSRDGTVACATCHVIAGGGDDGRPTAIGIDGQVGALNTPTVLNASLNFAQFWDGRAATLREQASGPIHNPAEMDSSLDEALARLAADPAVVKRFERAYPNGLTAENVIDAIVTYERALTTPNAPFDRYLAGDTAALGEQAVSGYGLFRSLGCISCHQGRNIGGNMFQTFGVMGDYFADRGNVTEADYGRYNVTGREADKFKFKVPSLRNVAKTAPYFHDGSAATLRDAVRAMIRYQLGRPLREGQVDDLVAFLESLTGEVDPELQ